MTILNYFRPLNWLAASRLTVIILCLIFISTTPLLAADKPVTGFRETSAFKKAQTAKTIEAYQEYLTKFPTGQHASEATASLEQLYFDVAQKDSTTKGYEGFLSRYPNGNLADSARKQIEDLQYAALGTNPSNDALNHFLDIFPNTARANEVIQKITDLSRPAYENAVNAKTIKAFTEFIQTYKRSLLADEARTKVEGLEFDAATSENTYGAYFAFLQKYPASPFAKEARAKGAAFAEKAFGEAKTANSITALESFLNNFPEGSPADEAFALLKEKCDVSGFVANKEQFCFAGIGKTNGPPTDSTRVAILCPDYPLGEIAQPTKSQSHRDNKNVIGSGTPIFTAVVNSNGVVESYSEKEMLLLGVMQFSVPDFGYSCELRTLGFLASKSSAPEDPFMIMNPGAEHIFSSCIYYSSPDNPASFRKGKGGRLKESTTTVTAAHGVLLDSSMSGIVANGRITGGDWPSSKYPLSSILSDPSYPLTFKVVKDKGYIYLCGRGIVNKAGTNEISFGISDTVYSWIPCLTSTNALMRQGAVQALGWLGKNREELVARCLRDSLADRDMDVRRDAAEALGKLGSSRDVQALKKAAEDADIWTAEVAQQAILTIQKRKSD